MTAADLGAVQAIADRVHVAYPEDAAVFAERLRLFPDGCWVLIATRPGEAGSGESSLNESASDEPASGESGSVDSEAHESGIVGYLISHPWQDRDPPKLNAMLGAIPAAAATYYIHDVAILPEHRLAGSARTIVAACIARARAAGLATVSLVAVNGSAPYWSRLGFVPVADSALAARLESYDADACLMALAL